MSEQVYTAEDTSRLIAYLHRGGQFNYWWRKNGGEKQSEWYEGDVAPLPTGENVYFNVCPVGAIPQRLTKGGGVLPKENVRHIAGEAVALNGVWADFDAKGFGGDKQAILDHIDGLPLRPSAIVDSGHGYHGYWLLEQPYIIDGRNSRREAATLQRGWVELVGGDPAASDLSRVLRVPGTVNHKASEGLQPVPVELLRFTDDTYTAEEILRLVGPIAKPRRESVSPAPGAPRVESFDEYGQKFARAHKALGMLKPERVEDYQAWVEVGMSLRELGQSGLTLWDTWSKTSSKYRPGDCGHKWETFTTDRDEHITIKSLDYWAEQDAGELRLPDAPKNPRPSDYMEALAALGFTFSLNTMNNDIHVNGTRQEDVIRAVLFTELAQRRYTGRALAENAWIAEASKHPFHPIRDYLNSLVWDGEPNIGSLCGYVDGGLNTRFNTCLRRWLIGAVARPFAGPMGCQARAFVMDGKQGIGKSRFVRYLGSPLPQFFMESGINTEDKDFLLYLASCWVWEVAELGSTMRKTDRDALKHYLSRQTVRVRRAYGHEYTDKPAVASFIPTINDEAGFLWDVTGYRRYMVATVEQFNWLYESEVDINGVWAEAVAAYKAGEPWELRGEEAAEAEAAAQEYEIDDPLVDFILRYFAIDKDAAKRKDAAFFVPTSTVLAALLEGGHIRDATRREAMQVGGLLLKLGCQRGIARSGDGQQRGYYGLRRAP